MIFIDRTLPAPAGNLAFDEALLRHCEAGRGEYLRVWEPRDFFIVLGRGGALQAEVKLEACRSDGVPILRRSSGGGTVLLGPGCLCYALVLPHAEYPELGSIRRTNESLLGRLARALSRVSGAGIDRRGDTDLAHDRHKVAGNAQQRAAHALLFHGVIPLALDRSRLGRYLRLPVRQPRYRAGRRHADFVRNLGVPAAAVKSALREEWNAREGTGPNLDDVIADLLARRYGSEGWTLAR